MDLTVAFISVYSLKGYRNSSGVPLFFLQALQETVNKVIVIDDIRPNRVRLASFRKYPLYTVIAFFGWFRTKLLRRFQRDFKWSHMSLLSKYYGWKVQRKLARYEGIDFIFADKASPILAYLKTDIPLIYSHDAPFAAYHEEYMQWNRYPLVNRNACNKIEQKALNNASLVLYRSRWAVESALKNYTVQKDKVSLVHVGPSLLKPPTEKKAIRRKSITDKWSMLVVAREWKRKGCGFAVDIVRELHSRGRDVELTICGLDAPFEIDESYIKIIKGYDKENELEQFISLYRDTDLFVFPTLAECLGISLIEACSFSLPVLVNDVGGTSDIVKDGVNGFLMSIEKDTPSTWSDKIEELMRDGNKYARFSENAFRTYRDSFNWKIWKKEFNELILEYQKCTAS